MFRAQYEHLLKGRRFASFQTYYNFRKERSMKGEMAESWHSVDQFTLPDDIKSHEITQSEVKRVRDLKLSM